MPPSRCDRRRIAALALIAAVSNAGYAAIAPILPLEIDEHRISERWVSLIFLAFSVGSSTAPPLVARRLESIGTVVVMSCSMVGMSILFWCLGQVFDVAAAWPSSLKDDLTAGDSVSGSANHLIIVGLLTVLQFFLGACFSAITTGYYSLATSLFAEKESAMSYIEASVGTGYILGPILGSLVYDGMGYRYAYTFISLGMMVMAFVTWKFLAPHLKNKVPEVADDDNASDEEALNAKGSFASYSSLDNDIGDPMNLDTGEVKAFPQQPSTVSLLKFPTILFAATNIMWINVSWTFIEPLLAKRLDDFHASKKEIGIIFSLSNMVYVPTVFLVQYLPRHRPSWRHRIILLSTMFTPAAVWLVGSDSFFRVIMGIVLLGLLPTPVWIMLLPFMQEESLMLFPDPEMKRCVNDVTAAIYNSFMTLGQVVGYLIGPLMISQGYARMAHVVALLVFLQSMLFCFFCTDYYGQRRRRDNSAYSSTKQII
mmetsp:Transcript_34706/g.83882  ORF Transcript_34706/g.83882 Transcript_34706/m.83882 type:complete len:483 (+) Transcript_34706:162-1610(+)